MSERACEDPGPVLAAITDLGYRPNTAACALVTRWSAIIGAITTGSPHFGPSSTFLSVELAARDAGYSASVQPMIDSAWPA